MAQQIPQIKTSARDRLGSRYAKRLREAGNLPAVIYGHGHDPIHVAVDAREFGNILDLHARLVEVVVDGNPQACLLKDVQYDFLDRTPVHVDLAIVNLDEVVEVEIGLDLLGEAIGLKVAGAMLDQQFTQVAVKCKARDIPESITHDISAMEAGTALRASDLTLPAGVSLAIDGDVILAQIEVREEQAEAVATGATAEPEVITKGKKEDPAAAAPAKGGKAAPAAAAGKGAAPAKGAAAAPAKGGKK